MAEQPFEVKDMTGSLFRNKEKQSDKSPDFTGTVKINGQLLRVSAWTREAKTGTKYLSMAFSEPRDPAQAADKPASKPTSFADMKEDLPF